MIYQLTSLPAHSNLIIWAARCWYESIAPEMVSVAREDFLMASRDRVRRNEVYDAIFSMLKDELRDHPGLREHNALRKKKRLSNAFKEENASSYLQELLKSDPTIASVLGLGGNIVSASTSTNDGVPFRGRQFPTFFRLAKEPKGGLIKPCPLKSHCTR